MKSGLNLLFLSLCLLLGLQAAGLVSAYEIIHPYEEFGDLTAVFDEDKSEVAVADLAYSISQFFKAKMFGFTDKTPPPDSGNYLELIKNSESAQIIYRDCYEGSCQNAIPILEFSCSLEADLCRQPRILFKGEEISLKEFLRRGDFNLPVSEPEPQTN